MGENSMTTLFESGYFTADRIPVPSELLCSETGIFHFQQVNPHASFAQITREDGKTFAIECTGNTDGALLSVCTPSEAFVKILLPVNTPPGAYQYRAYFYGSGTNQVIYHTDGTINVDDTEKTDCGCFTLGTVRDAPHESVDQVTFEKEWEARRVHG